MTQTESTLLSCAGGVLRQLARRFKSVLANCEDGMPRTRARGLRIR